MMITICNDFLQTRIDTLGAQLTALSSKGGTQYLWNADPEYWRESAPVLFPFVGRLKDSAHTVDGATYPMKIHGFASVCEFAVKAQTADSVTLTISDSAQTRASYPFSFDFSVTYSLSNSSLEITYKVANRDKREISFGLGGHPGFNVPLAEGTVFEDYSLCFSAPCTPDRIGFADDLLISGADTPYPLTNGQSIPLTHALFDDDAIILKNVVREVSLVSDKTDKSVTVSFPDMPYVGFWHKPNSDAPFVCIEPWLSLPGRHGTDEDFSTRSDLVHLAPGKVYENRWSITISEG